MRARVLFLSLVFCSSVAWAANDDLAGRVAALQFDQSVLRNSVNDQLREQNTRLNTELIALRTELNRQAQVQAALQNQARWQFIVFTGLFLLAASGACALPWYLSKKRTDAVRKEAEHSARDIKVTRELLDQMRGDFKAIQSKMRDYRSEFDLRLAEMKLHELEMQRGAKTSAPVAPPSPEVVPSAPPAVLDTQAIWRAEADSYRALSLAEPDEANHRRKLIAALRQGLSEGAEPAVIDEGLRECDRLLRDHPDEVELHCAAGAFCLARAGYRQDQEDWATAEAHWLEAERLQRGSAAYELVALYAQSGRVEEARKRLALARLAGVAKVEKLALLRSDPLLAPLREQAWFQSYLQSLESDQTLA